MTQPADPRATSIPERLVTSRLALRRPGPSDLPAFDRVMVDGDGVRELRDALAHWRAHAFGPWIVEEGGVPVAILEVHYAGPGVTGIRPDEIEIGWTVAADARRRGIAVEAAGAAAADAFERTEAPWLVAYIRPENAASISVAERIGMHHDADGLTRSGDPALIYRLPRELAQTG